MHLDPSDTTLRHRIPVTRAARTLIDIAPRLSRRELERIVNRADALDLVRADRLREDVEGRGSSAGASAIRRLLDPDGFRVTESELERMFVGLVRRAGLPPPATQVHLGGHRVDFHWPELGLVVEADSLTYHRTVATQLRDARRDREHAAAGLTTLRFSHWEVCREPGAVAASLSEMVGRLAPA